MHLAPLTYPETFPFHLLQPVPAPWSPHPPFWPGTLPAQQNLRKNNQQLFFTHFSPRGWARAFLLCSSFAVRNFFPLCILPFFAVPMHVLFPPGSLGPCALLAVSDYGFLHSDRRVILFLKNAILLCSRGYLLLAPLGRFPRFAPSSSPLFCPLQGIFPLLYQF